MATTNKEFLLQKLNNYRAFLKENSEEPDKVDELTNHSPEIFLAFASQNLVPLAESGQLHIAIEKTIATMKLRDAPEVRQKLDRYYNFLIDFLKSIN